jgi:hypothetical protein
MTVKMIPADQLHKTVLYDYKTNKKRGVKMIEASKIIKAENIKY